MEYFFQYKSVIIIQFILQNFQILIRLKLIRQKASHRIKPFRRFKQLRPKVPLQIKSLNMSLRLNKHLNELNRQINALIIIFILQNFYI